MLELVTLKNLCSKADFSSTEKILFCLAASPLGPKSVKVLRTTALSAGLRSSSKWNISSLLSRSKGAAILTQDGWELTEEGRNRVSNLAGPLTSGGAFSVAAGLRHHLLQIENKQVTAFVQEAVVCLESRLFRAAAVLSWVGALAVLYEHVVKMELAAFNAEARKRNAKWKDAKSPDGLAKMEEYEFLQILDSIGVIGKSVKQELEGCLKLRNGCGHPNSLAVGESRVSSHIEILVQNVFSKFAVD